MSKKIFDRIKKIYKISDPFSPIVPKRFEEESKRLTEDILNLNNPAKIIKRIPHKGFRNNLIRRLINKRLKEKIPKMFELISDNRSSINIELIRFEKQIEKELYPISYTIKLRREIYWQFFEELEHKLKARVRFLNTKISIPHNLTQTYQNIHNINSLFRSVGLKIPDEAEIKRNVENAYKDPFDYYLKRFYNLKRSFESEKYFEEVKDYDFSLIDNLIKTYRNVRMHEYDDDIVREILIKESVIGGNFSTDNSLISVFNLGHQDAVNTILIHEYIHKIMNFNGLIDFKNEFVVNYLTSLIYALHYPSKYYNPKTKGDVSSNLLLYEQPRLIEHYKNNYNKYVYLESINFANSFISGVQANSIDDFRRKIKRRILRELILMRDYGTRHYE